MGNSDRKKISRRNACLRAIVQLAFFVMMPGAFMAGFSGVKNIFGLMSGGSVLEMNSFVKALIGLCVFTVIFGRFFCGYACAFGTLGDFVYMGADLIRKKVLHLKKKGKPHDRLNRAAQKIKFLILALIVIGCAVGFYERLNAYNWNPWTVFSFIVAGRLELNGYVLGGIILAFILLGMAWRERFFCQYLCPMGAVFALLPQLPFAALQRDEENCIKNCRACQMKCPVSIKLEPDGFLNGECISCEKCADICPKGNISRWDRKLLKNEAAAVLVKGALLFSLGAWLGLCRFL